MEAGLDFFACEWKMLRWFPPCVTTPSTSSNTYLARQWDYRPSSITSLSIQSKSTIDPRLGHVTWQGFVVCLPSPLNTLHTHTQMGVKGTFSGWLVPWSVAPEAPALCCLQWSVRGELCSNSFCPNSLPLLKHCTLMLFFITHSCGFGNCYTHFYGAEEEISYLVLSTANGHLRFRSGFLIYFFIFEPKVCFTSVFKNVKDRKTKEYILY